VKARPTRGGVLNTRVKPSIHDYYLEGHSRARVSPTMAKASLELNTHENWGDPA
jgi:hypothetical protein